MARQVFFSFHYSRDSWRVAQVRNSNLIWWDKTPFYDKAQWEQVKRQGDISIKNWIDRQLNGSSVTVVLIGYETANRPWVQYEIRRSIELWKWLIWVHISWIKNQKWETDKLWKNPLPIGYKVYKWNADNGRDNLHKWIEDTIKNIWR